MRRPPPRASARTSLRRREHPGRRHGAGRKPRFPARGVPSNPARESAASPHYGTRRAPSIAAEAGHAVDADDGAGVRRVDELAAADVDPDVPEAVEEDEVAGLPATRSARSRSTARRCSAGARSRAARRRTSRGRSSRTRSGSRRPRRTGRRGTGARSRPPAGGRCRLPTATLTGGGGGSAGCDAGVGSLRAARRLPARRRRRGLLAAGAPALQPRRLLARASCAWSWWIDGGSTRADALCCASSAATCCFCAARPADGCYALSLELLELAARALHGVLEAGAPAARAPRPAARRACADSARSMTCERLCAPARTSSVLGAPLDVEGVEARHEPLLRGVEVAARDVRAGTCCAAGSA